MRIYLELIEVLPEGSAEEADFIRIDVTDWSKKDVDQVIQLLKEQAEQYEHYIIQMHYCYHEEGKPCSIAVIESK
jgi:hypothetical protein